VEYLHQYSQPLEINKLSRYLSSFFTLSLRHPKQNEKK
jgi:hypothetical protein